MLLRDFNSNNFSVPLNEIDHFTPELPNITVTTIPMKSIKARYYFNAKKYDKAISLLNEGIPANPYLFFSENLNLFHCWLVKRIKSGQFTDYDSF